MSAASLEGRVTRKKSNALRMEFFDGTTSGDGKAVAFATAEQSGGDGKGAKIGVLFGFKNGGPGKHRVEFTDGSVLFVESRDLAATLLTDGDGAAVASIERGDTSTVLDPGGTTLLRILGDGRDTDPTSDGRFDATIADAFERPPGTLHIIRTHGGWRTLDDIYFDNELNGYGGVQLKTPILGIRADLDAPVDTRTRNLLVAIGVDVAIGLRPYIAVQKR